MALSTLLWPLQTYSSQNLSNRRKINVAQFTQQSFFLLQEPINPKPAEPKPPKTDAARQQQSQLAQRRRAQEAVASLTADEINEFLAHSDKEDGDSADDNQSEASSDWDDVQEEDDLVANTVEAPQPVENSQATTCSGPRGQLCLIF